MPYPAGWKLIAHACVGVFIAFLNTAANAAPRGVSPYLPLNLSPEMERHVERVLLHGDRAVLTRPIAAATVLDALPRACEVDQRSCVIVRRYLTQYMTSLGITHASADGAFTEDVTTTLPNQRGLQSDSPWQASAIAQFQPSDYAMVSVGGVAYDGHAVATGSVLSAGIEYLQLDVGYRDHWFSPLEDSSMLISTQAPTLPSITLSNYTPITSWGIQYEAFLAELSHSDQIVFEETLTSGNPRLAGLHVSVQPVAGWSFGFNRLMQFGGGERGGNSIGDVWDAFFDPANADNANAPDSGEFGNQAASITSSFIYPGATRFSVFFEYAGEDTSRGSAFRLGNSALSVGLHFPRLWSTVDLKYQVSEWQNGWYVHHTYLDGLTNEGHVIGHWGADDRQPGDEVGAQSHTLSLSWDMPSGDAAEIRYRTLANEDYSTVEYQRMHELMLRYSHYRGPIVIGTELVGGRDVFGEDFGRLGVFVRYAGARSGLGPLNDSSLDASGSEADVFVDAGVIASSVRADLTDSAVRTSANTGLEPHIGIGARRAVTAKSDIGVRLELDNVDGEQLLAVRALDYRYRASRHLAFSAFFGAARYDLGTPAYGYYLGIGAQWRELVQNWDLGLDFRYADKVARDRLLPDDPAAGRPDIFYDISSAVLYLSRRF